MITKRKPPPRWQDRARRTVRDHPWTWGTAASIAAVIALVAPGVFWVGNHFQTVEAAELHAKDERGRFTELLYGQARQETLILRNKVNDCNARAARPAERGACEQYRLEYKESEQRTQTLFQKMQELSK